MQAISPDAPAYVQQLRRVALYLRSRALVPPFPQGDLDAWRLISELALAEQDRNLFLKWRSGL
jgi:hypothetical protein